MNSGVLEMLEGNSLMILATTLKVATFPETKLLIIAIIKRSPNRMLLPVPNSGINVQNGLKLIVKRRVCIFLVLFERRY